ncbi:uncharacterized protein METZ01_LOCUS311670, partial [marine metagenome]
NITTTMRQATITVYVVTHCYLSQKQNLIRGRAGQVFSILLKATV